LVSFFYEAEYWLSKLLSVLEVKLRVPFVEEDCWEKLFFPHISPVQIFLVVETQDLGILNFSKASSLSVEAKVPFSNSSSISAWA
jgi:hypothetical protein